MCFFHTHCDLGEAHNCFFSHQIDHGIRRVCLDSEVDDLSETSPKPWIEYIVKIDAPNTRRSCFFFVGEVDIGVTNYCKVVINCFIWTRESLDSGMSVLRQGKHNNPWAVGYNVHVLGSHPLTAGPIGSCVETPAIKPTRWCLWGRSGYRGCGGSQHGTLHRWYGCPGFEFEQLPHWTAFGFFGHVEIFLFKSTAINILCEHMIHCKKN